ncbi:MAG: nucleotidyltransferase [Syntrophaceae bacterium]|nr:nucleotidyltransferase [Syntrophaceae bacterium]
MKTREDILQILAREKRNLAAQFKVQSIALFGSYARNEQRQDSDVDILVDVDLSIGLEFVTLADRIEKMLGLPVELVSRGAIKRRYLKAIEQDLIYV